MFRKLAYYLVQGILFTVPIAVTVYVIVVMLRFIDQLLPEILPVELKFPGLGILILLTAITLIGFLGNTVIATPINYWFNKILDKAPLIKTVYTALTDFTQAIVGGKKRTFTEPVLVKLSEDIEKPGFITQSDLTEWGISEEKVMVYLPHSYGFTGNIFVVPKKNVRPLPMKGSEMMKVILSGGVASGKSEEHSE
ncbi:DUF502 domain-containing protein [bacterium SCSIO 12741]|nr:DUF502 domain-containing protein [bacterium SCSIO 12741]